MKKIGLYCCNFCNWCNIPFDNFSVSCQSPVGDDMGITICICVIPGIKATQGKTVACSVRLPKAALAVGSCHYSDIGQGSTVYCEIHGVGQR